MAKSKTLKWSAVIVIDGAEHLVAEDDGYGNAVRHMTDAEFEPYQDKILKNIGEGMSLYANAHPGSQLWKTN